MDKVDKMKELLNRYEQLEIFERGYSPATKLIIEKYIRDLEFELGSELVENALGNPSRGTSIIATFYGKEQQSRLAMEECGELIQAINKTLRYPEDEDKKTDLLEEIVDVSIMLDQLMMLNEFQHSDYIDVYIKKMSRVKKRFGNDLSEYCKKRDLVLKKVKVGEENEDA